MDLSGQTKHYLDYIQAHPLASLTEEEFSSLYENLIAIIGEHNKLYYIDSAPVIADAQYDELFSYLKNAEEVFPHLIRADSPTQRLTYQLQENFAQAEHVVPLLSLENSYNADDLKSWDESLQNVLKKYKKNEDAKPDDISTTYATAAALLKTQDGLFLFQKRGLDSKSNPGKIALFGGHLEPGETPEQALVRELFEELELKAKKKQITFLFDTQSMKKADHFGKKYLVDNIDESTLQLHEGDAIVKMSLEDALQRDDLTLIARYTIERYLESLSPIYGDMTYTAEPKYDGISIELIYERGQFTQAITRGDGYIGEDITENVKTMLSVPFYLKDRTLSLRVRGEIVMTKKAFERVNAERERLGEAVFANPRNATSGSLRQLDTSVTAKRGLLCYVYQTLQGEPSAITTHQESLEWLREQGFLVFPWIKHCSTIESVINVCTDVHTKQTFDKQEIDFDGIVVKVNEIPLRDILGETNHHPKRAMAYKFPAQQIVTKLLSIDWQVGRTGILTPTANLDPVMLGGVTISRASLHNADFIRDKDIKMHDSVWIQRSGEVIPYVVAPVVNARNGEEQEIQIPKQCPVCKTDVVRSKTDIHVYCPNATCPAQIKGKIAYRVSRDAMNIDGVGESIIELMVDQGLVKNVAELYTLEQSQKRIQMMAMPLIGQRKFQSIAEELKKSKNNPLWRVINGLGIQHIGKKTAQIIVEAITASGYTEKKDFGLIDLERLLTNEEFLLSIKGIGEETIISLRTWFSNEDNKHMLEQLVAEGISFSIFDLRKKVIEGKLSGISFCITGTFEIPRKVLGEIIAKHGGVMVDNVTQGTHFLIVGNDPSSKLEKATENNIPVIEGLEKLEQRFPFLADDIEPMKLLSTKKTEKKKEMPKQQGLFG